MVERCRRQCVKKSKVVACGPALPLPETDVGWGGLVTQTVDFDSGLEQQALMRCIALLSPVEKEVIMMRFGLAGTQRLPLVAVAKKLGRSVSGIRRIEVNALHHLRALLQDRDDHWERSA